MMLFSVVRTMTPCIAGAGSDFAQGNLGKDTY